MAGMNKHARRTVRSALAIFIGMWFRAIVNILGVGEKGIWAKSNCYGIIDGFRYNSGVNKGTWRG